MRRELDSEEKRIYQKSIDRISPKVLSLKDNLDYNEDLLKKQEFLRDFDDKHREYLRVRKNEDDNIVLKNIKDEISLLQSELDILKEGLEKGVEKKVNTLVK